MEAPPSVSDGAHHQEDDVTLVEDGTPRLIRSLPKPLQFLCLILVGYACIFIMGPITVLTILFVTPSIRRMVQEYRDEERSGNVVLGRVVDRTKQKYKFCTVNSEKHFVTVEYNVGESTYRKKFGMTKAQFDEKVEYTISSTVELLVLLGLPKSAMLKETIETLEKVHQESSWWCWLWQLTSNIIFLCFVYPVFLTQAATRAPFFSWDNLAHGCILGLVLFGIGALLFWWLNLVGKQETAFKDSAELVGAEEDDDDDTANVSTLPNDSLTAPLLSAVTGF